MVFNLIIILIGNSVENESQGDYDVQLKSGHPEEY